MICNHELEVDLIGAVYDADELSKTAHTSAKYIRKDLEHIIELCPEILDTGRFGWAVEHILNQCDDLEREFQEFRKNNVEAVAWMNKELR